jgi:hypothetical protein
MKRAKTLTYWIVPMLVMGLTAIGSAPLRAEQYQVVNVTDGGAIKGVASWKGDIPALESIPLVVDTEVCGEEHPSPALQVNEKNKGVRFVLVYLEQVERGKAPAAKYWFHMGKDKKNTVPGTEPCAFTEHVFPFVRSQVVAMVNYDTILHNPDFFNERGTTVLNVMMPSPYSVVDHTILQFHGKGVNKVQCDIHQNMNGYWAGFHHPYFAVTDGDGKFELSGIPAGKYTLVAWHEGFKVIRIDVNRPVFDAPHILRKEIEVKPKETVQVQFEFPARKVTME